MISRREFLGTLCAMTFGITIGKLYAESDNQSEMVSNNIFEKAREITIPNYRVHPIAIDGEERLEENGNGFVLGDKYFTAYHVYRQVFADRNKRLVVNGRVLNCLGFDTFSDVAVFQLPKELEDHMNDYEFDPNVRIYVGQRVLIYGNPNGYFFTHSEGFFKEGVVRKLNKLSICNRGFVDYNAFTIGGDSGSPVLDAETGDVLGAVVGVYEEKKGTFMGDIGAFVPISRFSKFISKN